MSCYVSSQLSPSLGGASGNWEYKFIGGVQSGQTGYAELPNLKVGDVIAFGPSNTSYLSNTTVQMQNASYKIVGNVLSGGVGVYSRASIDGSPSFYITSISGTPTISISSNSGYRYMCVISQSSTKHTVLKTNISDNQNIGLVYQPELASADYAYWTFDSSGSSTFYLNFSNQNEVSFEHYISQSVYGYRSYPGTLIQDYAVNLSNMSLATQLNTSTNYVKKYISI